MLAGAWLGRGFWGPLRGVRPLAGSGGSCPGPRRTASLGLGLGLGLGLTLAPRAAGCLRLLRAPAVRSHRSAAPLPPPTPQPPPRPVPESPQEAARGELYENPWTIPNLLSLVRIGLAPVLGYLIVEEDFNVALGVFTLAGITDLLDGFIARNWVNQKSVLGSALDPLADKILISVLYVSLTCANLIPVPLTSLIILRDIVLVAAVFYVRFKTLSPPRTLSRYFNPCYATAQLKPTFISKINTAVQLILVAASLAAPVFNYVDSVYLHVLWSLSHFFDHHGYNCALTLPNGVVPILGCLTALTTTASGYSYYHYGKKTFKVLNNK